MGCCRKFSERNGQKMFSIREIFDLAIRIEKNGEQFYRDAMKKISNPPLKPLLEWLADEEVKHEGWFIERKKMLETKGNDLELEDMGSSILQGILGDQSFSLREADLSKVDSVEALIQLAVEFEKDSILFYEMIASLIGDDETSEKLNEIIAEENRHIELLEDFQDAEGDALETRERD